MDNPAGTTLPTPPAMTPTQQPPAPPPAAAGPGAVPTSPPPAGPGGLPPTTHPPAPEQTQRPVGAPSGDPEKDQARLERQQINRRLDKVLPPEMKEHRFEVFKLINKRGIIRQSRRAVMKIPISEVEEANQNNESTKDFIMSRIGDEKGHRGRWICELRDNRGSKVHNVSPFEVNFDEEVQLTDFEDEDDYVDDEHLAEGELPHPHHPQQPAVSGSQQVEMAKLLAGATSEARQNAASDSSTTLAMMMQMMANMNNQQQSASSQTMQMITAMFASSKDRDDERRREEDERRREQRESEASRRDGTTKLLVTALTALGPAVAGFVAKIMEKDPDTITPMLMEMIKSGNNNSAMKDLISMSQEGAKEQMKLQGIASQQALEMAGKASSGMVTNIMGLYQEIVRAQMEGGDGGSEDMIDKIGKIAGLIGKAIPGAGAMPILQQPEVAPSVSEAVVHSETGMVPVEAPEEEPAETVVQSSPDGIRDALWTIMRLEKNEIPVMERVRALDWARRRLPSDMERAIRAGQEDQVVALGHPVIAADPKLSAWLNSDQQAVPYMLGAIKEIQRIMLGQMDQEAVNRSVTEQRDYQVQRGRQPNMGPQPQAEPQADVAPPETPVEATVTPVVVEPEPDDTPRAPRRSPVVVAKSSEGEDE